jgi:hypothetical protein
MTTTQVSKEQFEAAAIKYGVKAGYSGKDNTMYVTGEDAKVKSFIRVRNLMGKSAYSYAIKQSK